MEKELFEWTTWQEDGVGIFTFNVVKLVKQIGEYPIGTEFDCAFLDFQTGELEFANFNHPEKPNNEFSVKFKLSLNVQ